MDGNPYHPPTPSNDSPDRRSWLPVLWNTLLFGIAMVLLLAACSAVGWIVAQSADAGAITRGMLLRLATITQVSLFYLLFLLSLSTPFWRPRESWWRTVYFAEAIVLLVDFDWLQPTRESLVMALIFVILVLPVLSRGYGWIGAVISGWRLFRKRHVR